MNCNKINEVVVPLRKVAYQRSQISCACYKCKATVPAGLGNHFTSIDGRILCDKCSIGVVPCSRGNIYKLLGLYNE